MTDVVKDYKRILSNRYKKVRVVANVCPSSPNMAYGVQIQSVPGCNYRAVGVGPTPNDACKDACISLGIEEKCA